jgi:hypothetical protein bacD2_03232
VFTGCIAEDTDDCILGYEIELHFRDLDVTRGSDYFLDHVGSVQVGVWDQAGTFLFSRSVNKNSLQQFQGIRLDLFEGDYTAVCWGNATGANSYIDYSKGLDTGSDVLYHPNYPTGKPIPTNDSLYYGRLDFTVQGLAASHTVYFKPAHVKLRIEVRGLQHIDPPLANINDLSIRVTDLCPAYTNTMAACGTISTYYPRVKVDAVFSEATAYCDILRFDGDTNPITIQVAANSLSAPLHTESLADFMTTHGLTIADGHELAVNMIVSFSQGGGVKVTISPWVGQPTIPGGM